MTNGWSQLRGFYSRGVAYPEKLREAPAGANQLPVFLASGKVGDTIFDGTGINPATAFFGFRFPVTPKAPCVIP